MRALILIGPLVVLCSCGNGKSDVAHRMASLDSLAQEHPEAQVQAVELNAYDIPLQLVLPEMLAEQGDSLQVHWSEEFGRLEVRAGDHFALNITEGFGDIGRLKADLGRDMLQKNTIVRDQPDRLVYRSTFPDGDLVFVHFLRVITVGDRTFEVTDAEGGRYNEADVDRMMNAVSPQSPT
ncbi:MAG: hypothetical protein H6597_03410 [Flavobacteriales bacterium]|nr:hypothetical protein [Flavobacteriales bacterium]MCB9193555.1 hypothetical protein [Flavobacteriales bacterium]